MDGRLYIGQYDYLAVVEEPNVEGLGCRFRDRALWLEGDTCTFGLPNFIDAIFNEGEDDGLDCAIPISRFDADTAICEGQTIEFKDQSTRHPESWLWRFEGGLPADFEGQEPPPVLYERAGSFTVTLTTGNTNGFDTARTTVTVHPLPVVDAGADVVICRGSVAQLGASGAVSYLWRPAAGLDDSTAAAPVASPDQTTTYYVTGTNEFGCTALDSVTVVVADTVTAEAGPDARICAGDAVRLAASGGAEYRWRPAEGLSDTTVADPIASPLQTTEYVVRVSSGTCEDYDTVIVTVVPLPLADAGPDRTTCPGAPVRLLGSGEGRYSWSPGADLDDSTAQEPVARPRSGTVYTLTVTGADGCTARDTVRVIVASDLDVDAGADITICRGDSVQLRATGAESYMWEPAGEVSDSAIADPWVRPERSTHFIVTGRADGCEGSDTVRVTVLPLPELRVSPDQVICDGEEVELWAEGGENYAWHPAQSLDDTAAARPTARPQQSTTYTVTATGANGCEAEADVRVEVLPKVSLTLQVETLTEDALPGDEKLVRLFVRGDAASLQQASVSGLHLVLAYDTEGLGYNAVTGIRPGAAAADWSWSASEDARAGTLTISGGGSLLLQDGTLLTIPLDVFLSDHDSLFAPIGISALSGTGDGRCFSIESFDGGLPLSPYCLRNLRSIGISGVRYSLSTARPNPARDRVRIAYRLGLASATRLRVYNAVGTLVREPVDAYQPAGAYEINVEGLAAGVYHYELSSGPYRAVRTLVITR